MRDDGPGFRPDGGQGRGLRNMRDCMEAIGGHLSIDAQLGRCTRILGSMELPAPTK